jgi:hypothetical protein
MSGCRSQRRSASAGTCGTDRPRLFFRSLSLFLGVAVLLTGCTTPSLEGGDAGKALSVDLPDWVLSPPAEEGYFFGIGSDFDLGEAKKKSLINIGQQFGSRVRTALYENQIFSGEETESMMAAIDRQFTDHEVVGAKFADQSRDTDGNYWVLTRAPLDCILDVTESVLLSYSLNLRQADADNVSVNTLMDAVPQMVDDIGQAMETGVTTYFTPPAEFSAADGSASPGIPPAMIDADGRGDDWAAVSALITDPAGDKRENVDGTDITSVSLAHDGLSLFLRIDLADGRPRKNGLYYAVGLREVGGSWERLLFTVYDGSWSTGVNEWTDNGGRHRQTASGKVKYRSGVIEAEYSLVDLDFPDDAVFEVNAWCDPSGQAYDVTDSAVTSLMAQEDYFLYKGRIHGHQLDRISRKPIVAIKNEAHLSLTRIYSIEDEFTDQEGNSIRVDVRFDPSTLKIGRNRLDNNPEGKAVTLSAAPIFKKTKDIGGTPWKVQFISFHTMETARSDASF